MRKHTKRRQKSIDLTAEDVLRKLMMVHQMMGIILVKLSEMFHTMPPPRNFSKVTVNSEAAAVGQRQQSSSPLSVWFYKAWEP